MYVHYRVANVVVIHDDLLTQWVNSAPIFFWYKLLPTTYGPHIGHPSLSAETAFFNEIVKYKGPRITRLWEWEKTVLHEIRVGEQFLTY